MPSSVLHDKIPHSMLFLDDPVYSLPTSLVVPVLFMILLQGKTLTTKALKCFFLRYSPLQKGYHCYSLDLGRYLVYAVTFFEKQPFFTSSDSSPFASVPQSPIVYRRRSRPPGVMPATEDVPGNSPSSPVASLASDLAPRSPPIALCKGIRSTRNPHPFYAFLSYDRLSPQHYT